jgi:multiple sugar transport system substrate-binding protein
MTDITRREALKTGAGLVAAGLAGTGIGSARAETSNFGFKPEKDAKLRILRWSQFVQGDWDAFMANTKRFTDKTGVAVRVDKESFEDIRPKAAVAANVGSGPDIVFGWFDDPQQFPDKLVPLTDLADYLGKKYDGWYPVAEKYGTLGGEWIGLPWGVLGGTMNYRVSAMRQAGFEKFPTDMDGFLKLCQGLRKIGLPAGFALGHAVGDATTWCHWLVWAHGGKMVDENNAVAIDSPQTIAALEYARELYAVFVEGTTSWLDPSNNKAFLNNQIGLTSNGISIYYVAKKSQDPEQRKIAEDMNHAPYPVGPAGRPTELQTITQAMIFKHTKYPNAAKEYLRFLWERDQYEPWQQASLGYVCQPLRAYASNPVWTEDPKATPFRDTIARMLDNGHAGRLGYASAAVMADYVMVDMVAEAATGQHSPKDAAQRAARRAERYYKI